MALEFACAALALLSVGLNLWQWLVALRFPLHHRSAPPVVAPAVTVLKPLRGADPDTATCLESWMTQEFPGPLQILFGVETPDDPAAPIVRRLLAAHPGVDAQLVICPESRGANGKVSKLIQLSPRRRHELIVVSDADVLAPRDLLANLVAPFRDGAVGLVSCFYRLANPATLAMHWEAVALHADFWAQVLQARSLGLRGFALGAVMAMRARNLEAAGGFASVADHLADDYELGRRIARLGARVELSSLVVDCRDARQGWRDVWRHQLRWARTVRVCRPVAYFFGLLNNVTFWAALWAVAAVWRGSPGVTLWAAIACLGVRIVTAWGNQFRLTGSAEFWRFVWRVPIKDLLQVAVWTGAFTGRSVWWRGERHQVGADGRLVRAAPPDPEAT